VDVATAKSGTEQIDAVANVDSDHTNGIQKTPGSAHVKKMPKLLKGTPFDQGYSGACWKKGPIRR